MAFCYCNVRNCMPWTIKYVIVKAKGIYCKVIIFKIKKISQLTSLGDKLAFCCVFSFYIKIPVFNISEYNGLRSFSTNKTGSIRLLIFLFNFQSSGVSSK